MPNKARLRRVTGAGIRSDVDAVVDRGVSGSAQAV